MYAELTAISLVVLASGCSGNVQSSESNNVTEHELDFVWWCETTKDLERFYSRHSLGGNVQTQTSGRLVFVQTFPYSGIDASHLCVYALASNGLRFVAFFYIPTHDNVVLNAIDKDSVDIRAADKRVATVAQPR